MREQLFSFRYLLQWNRERIEPLSPKPLPHYLLPWCDVKKEAKKSEWRTRFEKNFSSLHWLFISNFTIERKDEDGLHNNKPWQGLIHNHYQQIHYHQGNNRFSTIIKVCKGIQSNDVCLLWFFLTLTICCDSNLFWTYFWIHHKQHDESILCGPRLNSWCDCDLIRSEFNRWLSYKCTSIQCLTLILHRDSCSSTSPLLDSNHQYHHHEQENAGHRTLNIAMIC